MQNIILLDWAKPQGQTTMVDGKQCGGDILNNGKRIGHGYTKQIIGERKGDTIFLLGANDGHMADRSAGGGGQAAETGGNYNVMPIDIMPGKDSRQYHNTLKGIVTKFVKNGGKVVVPCQTITAFKKESWWKDYPATHLSSAKPTATATSTTKYTRYTAVYKCTRRWQWRWRKLCNSTKGIKS